MARPYRTRWDERDVFRALGHPVRRKIVVAALEESQSFSELRRITRRSDAALAGHLRILREAKIITATRKGYAVSYRVNRQSVRADAHWLATIAADKAGPA